MTTGPETSRSADADATTRIAPDASQSRSDGWGSAELIALGRFRRGVVAIGLAREPRRESEDSRAPDAPADERDRRLREIARRTLSRTELTAWVSRRESEASADGRRIRWVWHSSAVWYPPLLDAGVRVERCTDLRLNRTILTGALPGSLGPSPRWDAAPDDPASASTLFDLVPETGAAPDDAEETAAELLRHDRALAQADPVRARRLRLLLAAESAGSLVAVEMTHAGLPWSRPAHERILEATLGRRVAGGTPALIAERATEVRAALGDPTASLDSQPKLLRSLHRAGVDAASTSKWVLAEYDHPAIEPLLDYKRMMRLYSANGWAWLDEWVDDGRFRPVYVPGGVVTGRWASSGGGALQIPRALREAVRADDGWVIVDADVAQLEPRVLAAMAGDEAMANAARGTDLYDGIVRRGIAESRDAAKYAVLGALYGSTTGDAARLMPRMRREFPRAIALVDAAARAGERGERVETLLGRTSPAPDEAWRALQSMANASAADERAAGTAARSWGRFTRNFVVQGTAAEWALAWMADLRGRLAAFAPVARAAGRSGAAFSRRPHLAFFLHDEVMVHAPAEHADAVVAAIEESAAQAARIMFGGFPIDFPLDIRVGSSAAKS